MSSNKSVTCNICSTSFASRNQLFVHLRERHTEFAAAPETTKSTSMTMTMMSAKERTAASIAARSQFHNPHHEEYYRVQCTTAGVITMEEFLEAQLHFRKPLPVSFRVSLGLNTNMISNNQHYSQRQRNGGNARMAMFRLLESTTTTTTTTAAAAAPSYCALQASPYFSPSFTRVARIPPRQWTLAAQNALKDAQDVGAVDRQELCSMIPPILLLSNNNDASSLTILDLCAAPGSKSLQLLDQMNNNISKERTAKTTTTGGAATGDQVNDEAATAATTTTKIYPHPSGLLVCNDSNRSRLMTVARRSRIQPRSCLVLNSSDGRYFPALRKWGGYKLKFDRVLCDVPCSGDGTLRKLSGGEWAQWSVKSHLQLHKLQLRLLMRALELVKKGGRVVYSTCSIDPIEDEAVVASAIIRLGGPSVYKIVQAPTRLHADASLEFEYAAGATSWKVPHPAFRADNPITYDCIRQVPKQLRKKDILPSMFPPSTRRESDLLLGHDDDDDDCQTPQEKSDRLEQAKFYGDVVSAKDIEDLDRMLPNCCRILPQHMDSGGFFCAIIERVNPVYFAICFPLQKEKETPRGSSSRSGTSPSRSSPSPYHGRIYHPVESAAQIRTLLAAEKASGQEVYFEGVATLEIAQQWLRQHGSYVVGISEEAVPVPVTVSIPAQSTSKSNGISDDDENATKHDKTADLELGKRKRTWDKAPLYTPMYRSPNPSLSSELCDFFGLCTDDQTAARAGVDRFPLENLVVMGGGDSAPDIETCLDPDVAHVKISEIGDNDGNVQAKKYPRRRFLQLALVSQEIRSLFAGGAKFSPIEAGLALCWVPIPGRWRRPINSKTNYSLEAQTEQVACADTTNPRDDDAGNEEKCNFVVKSEESATSRSEKSGRYGLLDEAAELIGNCATRRIVALTKAECLQLLESSFLELNHVTSKVEYASNPSVVEDAAWWKKWGKSRLQDMTSWSSGAAIVVSGCGDASNSDLLSSIFLSCVLRDEDYGTHFRRLELLSEKRLSDSFLRLLKSSS
jgi:16S rRNA C967 or C1407 C5-methylase (RsmB/RsmF family)